MHYQDTTALEQARLLSASNFTATLAVRHHQLKNSTMLIENGLESIRRTPLYECTHTALACTLASHQQRCLVGSWFEERLQLQKREVAKIENDTW
jgi:hypothetical protein